MSDNTYYIEHDGKQLRTFNELKSWFEKTVAKEKKKNPAYNENQLASAERQHVVNVINELTPTDNEGRLFKIALFQYLVQVLYRSIHTVMYPTKLPQDIFMEHLSWFDKQFEIIKDEKLQKQFLQNQIERWERISIDWANHVDLTDPLFNHVFDAGQMFLSYLKAKITNYQHTKTASGHEPLVQKYNQNNYGIPFSDHKILLAEALENRLIIEGISYKHLLDDHWMSIKFDEQYFKKFIPNTLLTEFKNEIFERIHPLNNFEINKYLSGSLEQFKKFDPAIREKEFIKKFSTAYWFPNHMPNINENESRPAKFILNDFATFYHLFVDATEQALKDFKAGLLSTSQPQQLISAIPSTKDNLINNNKHYMKPNFGDKNSLLNNLLKFYKPILFRDYAEYFKKNELQSNEHWQSQLNFFEIYFTNFEKELNEVLYTRTHQTQVDYFEELKVDILAFPNFKASAVKLELEVKEYNDFVANNKDRDNLDSMIDAPLIYKDLTINWFDTFEILSFDFIPDYIQLLQSYLDRLRSIIAPKLKLYAENKIPAPVNISIIASPTEANEIQMPQPKFQLKKNFGAPISLGQVLEDAVIENLIEAWHPADEPALFNYYRSNFKDWICFQLGEKIISDLTFGIYRNIENFRVFHSDDENPNSDYSIFKSNKSNPDATFDDVFEDAFRYGMLPDTNEKNKSASKNLHNFGFNVWLQEKYKIPELTQEHYNKYCNVDKFAEYLKEESDRINAERSAFEKEKIRLQIAAGIITPDSSTVLNDFTSFQNIPNEITSPSQIIKKKPAGKNKPKKSPNSFLILNNLTVANQNKNRAAIKSHFVNLKNTTFPFLNKKTTAKDFVSIFNATPGFKKIDCVADTLSDLHHYISFLYNSFDIVERVTPSHWQVAAKCFTYKGEEISATQLKGNKDKISAFKTEFFNAKLKDLENHVKSLSQN